MNVYIGRQRKTGRQDGWIDPFGGVAGICKMCSSIFVRMALPQATIGPGRAGLAYTRCISPEDDSKILICISRRLLSLTRQSRSMSVSDSVTGHLSRSTTDECMTLAQIPVGCLQEAFRTRSSLLHKIFHAGSRL